MEESKVINLLVGGERFTVKKDMLCEHSDYFRAMFSGSYVEKEKENISINVVDANSMNIIIQYMELGLIDLSEFDLSTIGDLALAANFLQVLELNKQIEYCLDLLLSPYNWIEIMIIAESSSYNKLEEKCVAYGLYQFKLMKPQCINTVRKLVWYLSHSQLNADTELEVFQFGLDWIIHKETGADALLIILGCLDTSRISKEDIDKMAELIRDYVNSLAEKVIYCLRTLVHQFSLNIISIMDNRDYLCEMYSVRVYNEVVNLVSNSKKRYLLFKPCVALWANDKGGSGSSVMPHYLHVFHEDKFNRWLEVAQKDLWGWNVVNWGPTKIVIVCGEHGRGTGYFWKGLKVYDTLTKEWTDHGVELPIRRHGGVAIVDNSLYIFGGVGGYRVILDTAIIYDLKQQTFRSIAKFPDAIQTPGVCTHNNVVYGAGHKNIYYYEDNGESDRWVQVLETNIRPTCMLSYKGYIYCIQNYFNNLYRFKPKVDTTLETITYFSNSPSTLCYMNQKLLAFTNANVTQSNLITVEEYDHSSENPQIRWSKTHCEFTINDVAGSCVILDTVPSISNEFSTYLQRYISAYENCH